MNRLIPFVFAAAVASVGLAACETTYGPAGPYAYGYVDGYYDDAYGPFYDGYWGPDAFFYYRTSHDGDFIRDDGRHFRRDAASGFHTFHSRAGRAPAQAAAPREAPEHH